MSKHEEAKLGRLIDKRYSHRESRLNLQREVDGLKEVERTLEGQIMNLLAASGLGSARGQLGQASTYVQVVPSLTDWEAFFKFAKRKGNDDLLIRRVHSAAWKERQDSGILVPGVEPLRLTKLSITKA